MKIITVIPTYNEVENIGPLLEELQRHYREIPHETHTLVVDDGSPDGTALAVMEKQRRYANIHLLNGKKEGLGAAYVRGMRHALENLEADLVFEMDADFSHKPEDILPMVTAIEEGADFVIGSRYVSGGKIPEKWGFLRRMNSRCGNIVARYLAGLHKVRDCTAGFRAIRASVLQRINLNDIGVRGYAFQIALLYKAMANGAAIREVPVEFVDRTRGKSKLGLADIAEFILSAGKIRFRDSGKSFIKFSIVGASGVVVNLAFFSFLLSLGVSKYLASPVAVELSILWNFFLNNFWTFRSRDVTRKMSTRGVLFNTVALLGLGLSYSVFLVLNSFFPDLHPAVQQIISILPATALNYSLNSRWTFRESRTGLKEQLMES
ncbi:MAG: glycosyltransferase family 2 protein [Syntrophobacter sp.]